MKHFLLAVFLLGAVRSQALAQSDVYLCIDANGRKEYRNTGPVKGCKLVDLPRMITTPAPPSANKSAAGKTASAPNGFPKVDEGTQRSRDSESKQILQDELKQEQSKLAALKKEYNGGEVERHGDEVLASKYIDRVNKLKDDVARAEKNVDALKREISNRK